jgi:MerR-like DNA binding protein
MSAMHANERPEGAMEGDTRLSAEDVERSLGISRQELDELVSLGLAEPVAPGSAEYTVATVIRLQRVRRLHADLDVDVLGAAIIVDLLERLDRLEAEIRAIRTGRTLSR